MGVPFVHNGESYQYDEKYSYKDFTGRDLSERKDMSSIVIYSSCFSQEKPGSLSLPSNLTGTTFIACNLDNVSVPAGNTVIDCSVRKFKAQNDLEDWIVDDSLVPIEPVNKELFQHLGISVNPIDIPAVKQTQPATIKKMNNGVVVGDI